MRTILSKTSKRLIPIFLVVAFLAVSVAIPLAIRARTITIQGPSTFQGEAVQATSSYPGLGTAPAAPPVGGGIGSTPVSATDTGNLPSRLIIPSLGISSHIQMVGLTPEGNMDIAHSAVDVAWYKLGPKPGEVGSAVINGHINTYYSEHGVFEHLDRLNAGDIVKVQAENGATLNFVVTGKKMFDYNAPTAEIFANTSGRYLNLITCAGEWMTDKHLYDKRLVVFTELQR